MGRPPMSRASWRYAPPRSAAICRWRSVRPNGRLKPSEKRVAPLPMREPSTSTTRHDSWARRATYAAHVPTMPPPTTSRSTTSAPPTSGGVELSDIGSPGGRSLTAPLHQGQVVFRVIHLAPEQTVCDQSAPPCHQAHIGVGDAPDPP